MAITKARRQALVEQYRELMARSQGIILASYSGTSVKDLERLRRKVRDLGGEFHVVKNRLVKVSLGQIGVTLPEESLEGSTAVGFSPDDPLALAKALVEFSKENEQVRVKAGVVDGVVYSGVQMVRLAEMPPLPVIRARLIGLMNAPATRLAGILSQPARGVLNVVKAYADRSAAAAA